ncbi:MAG: phage capsid protein [Desulfovibrionaceae bacterium]
MSTSIDLAFVEKYADTVHMAYQQHGSKLRNTVRVKDNVQGATVKFQKVGKGMAGKKTRHGNVPLMNVDHSTVTATMEDWYGADYCDMLDEVKINFDEVRVIADAGAFAVGRKIDALLLTAMAATSNAVEEAASGLNKAKITEAVQRMNENDVPDDGGRFCVVGAHQWEELMHITEFASADFVGDQLPFLKGTESKLWRGITWLFHSGLPLSGGTRTCFMYHKNAIGLGEAKQMKAYIDWVPEKAAHLINHCLSAGAVLIDPNGCVEIACDDDAALS